MSAPQATLHLLTGAQGSTLQRALLGGSHMYRGHAAIVSALPQPVARVSGPAELVAAAERGLAEGPARAEAVAVRLRRRGVVLAEGEPFVVHGIDELAEHCRTLGRSSVEMVRADRSLLTEMRIGAWFDAPLEGRLIRRLALTIVSRTASRHAARRVASLDHRAVRIVADAAFWAGVREVASDAEWRRLTSSGYVALLYHRMAGEDRPGEEKLDVAPERLASHLRLLRRLRFTTLGPERQLTFHADGDEPLPARSVVLTVDDGFRDCAGPLLAHAGHRPQLFVPTHELGGSGHWLAGEPLLDWPEVVRLESGGVRVGAHARRHRPLDSLDERTRRAELEGSRRDLEDRVTQPLPLLSYPSGRHDTSVRGAAAQAGFAAAYTTEKGRNGAGTDPYCLRRVSVYGYDGTPALAWKALTGQAVPALWERRRISRIRRGSPRPRGTILRTHPPAGVLVSVVMPAFAPRRDWLLQAVESVLGERGCAIELVVVDDGSPDPVADMLATIADSRLRIVRTEHGGTSRARNAGVTAARGDYVRFVDSDDVVEPGGTAHLLGMIAGEHDRIAYGATLICDEQLEPVRLMRCRLDGSIASSCLLDEVEVRIFSMLFPRAVLEATGKWEPALRVCQDWDYALRAFEHARVRGDERVVTRYRRHAAGASADMDACLLGERLVVARYFGRHPEHRGTSLERRARARLERTAARTHRGGRWRFARAMGRALALAPLDTARELARDAAGAARGAARAAYKLIAAAPAPAGPARRPS